MNAHPSLLGLYRPGLTLLHRLPAGVKLIGLCVMGTVLLIVRSAPVSVGALAVALGLVLASRISVAVYLRALRPLLVVAALLLAFQWWQADWASAVQVTSRMLALVIVATVVTATTPTDSILDAVTRALSALRRCGVDTDRIALAIALMLRAIPRLFTVAQEARDAARARGLDRSPRALLVPMVVRSVSHARATGDALAARGIGDV